MPNHSKALTALNHFFQKLAYGRTLHEKMAATDRAPESTEIQTLTIPERIVEPLTVIYTAQEHFSLEVMAERDAITNQYSLVLPLQAGCGLAILFGAHYKTIQFNGCYSITEMREDSGTMQYLTPNLDFLWSECTLDSENMVTLSEQGLLYLPPRNQSEGKVVVVDYALADSNT